MPAGFYHLGLTGSDQRADSLDPSFWADPARVLAAAKADADALGLVLMPSMPQGRVAGIYTSNLSAALAPHVWDALCAQPYEWAIYTGWPVSQFWRTRPAAIDAMPPEGSHRIAPAVERRAWVAMNWSPLQAASRCRYWLTDYSQDDAEGLKVAESYLRRSENADCYGELPLMVRTGDGNADWRLDDTKLRAHASVGWCCSWHDCERFNLYRSVVPAGVECHIFPIPVFSNGVRQPAPDPAKVRTAIANGWRMGGASGWSVAENRAIRNPPAPPPATDAA